MVCSNYNAQTTYDLTFKNNSAIPFKINSNSSIYIKGDLIVEKEIVNQGNMYLYKDIEAKGTTLFQDPSSSSSSGVALGKVIFSGTDIQNIKGDNNTSKLIFVNLEVNNLATGSSDVIKLNKNIDVFQDLKFTSGNISLNGNNIFLEDLSSSSSNILDETNDNRIFGFPGEVYVDRVFGTGSVETNIAGIGLGLTFDGNLGSTRIARRNDYVVNVSDGSIKRYFTLQPSNTGDVRSPELFYFSDELNPLSGPAISASDLNVYFSDDIGATWLNEAGTPFGNSIKSTDSIFSLPASNDSYFTLAEKNCDSLTPVDIVETTIAICDGGSATIVPIGTANIYSSWSTGEIADSIEVTSPGTYTVTIIDSRGCENEDFVDVVNALSPDPSFSISPSAGRCDGEVMTFDYSNPSASGQTYFWNFDDPNASSNSDTAVVVNPSYTYVYPGSFNPTLTVTNANGCTATSSEPLTISPYPIASFTANDECMGDAVSFVNNSSISSGVNLVSTWDFNTIDATTTNVSNSNLSTVSYTYPAAASYTVSLSVSAAGCSNSINQNITVHPNPVAIFSLSTNDTICPNQTFNLVNSTDTTVIPNISFNWNFGNLATSSVFSPSYSYENSNPYNIILTASTPFGCSDDLSQTLVVSDLPTPSFTFANSCEDSLIYFDNSLTDSSHVYFWDFDNNAIDSVMDPTYAFLNYGLKNVQLKVTNVFGCIDSVTNQVEVFPNPLAFFPPTRGCNGNDINFFGANSTIPTGSISTYEWLYGDGYNSSSSSSNAVHSYSNPTTNLTHKYNATLQVTSDFGCTNSFSDSVTIFAAPDINLGGTVDVLLKPDSTLVLKTCGNSITLSSNNPGCSFEWFNPLFFSTSSSVTVNTDGMYFLELTAPLASSGCTSYDSVYVKLNSKITPNLGAISTFCDAADLSSGYPNSASSWFLNDTLSAPFSTNPNSVTVLNSGLYIVKVIDQNSCIGWDSLQVVINTSPNITLSDTSLCLGLPLSLDPQYTGPSGASYQWYLYEQYDISTPNYWASGIPTPNSLTNVSNSPTLAVDSSYQYFVEITDVNGCKDTAVNIVSFSPVPVVDFGVDTAYCDSILLVDSNVGTNYSYSWHDGSSNSSFLVNTVGTNYYSLEVSLGACSDFDDINITINASPVFDLGSDTILCSYQNLPIDLSTYGDVFDWNSGSSASSIVINSTGNYLVEVGDTTGCATEDSIYVTMNPVFQFDLGPDVFKCLGTDKLISTGLDSAGYAFYWSSNVLDTTSGNNINSSNSSSVFVDSNGVYYVQVTDPFGCDASDTISVLPTNLSLYARFLMAQSSPESDSIFYNKDKLPLLNLSYPSPYTTLWEVSEPVVNGGNYLVVWNDTNAIALYDNGPYYAPLQPDSINRKVKLTVTNSVCSAEKIKDITVYKYINKDSDFDPSKPFVLTQLNTIKANLYPNPSFGLINLQVELDYEADIDVFIYNTMGQLLNSESFYAQKTRRVYDMSIYNRGVYIAVIKTGEVTKSIKFIKL